jgi:hypothetical protein
LSWDKQAADTFAAKAIKAVDMADKNWAELLNEKND